MNKRLVLFFTLLIIAGQYYYPINGFGYKGTVHNNITSTAVQSQSAILNERIKEIGFSDGYKTVVKGNTGTQSVWKWVAKGSEWEDSILINYYWSDLYRGISNGHFYNPITKTGLLNKNNEIIGQSLIDRANEYSDNEWSYPAVKHFYYIALIGDGTELSSPVGYGDTIIRDHWKWGTDILAYTRISNLGEADRNNFFAWVFQGLGHNLHLIQDASVPAHTRNDFHGPFEPYEYWTYKNAGSLPYTGNGSDSWNYWKEYNTAFPKGAITPGVSSNSYHAFIDLNTTIQPGESLNQGIAQYSHANFLSEDSFSTFEYPERPSWWGEKPDYSDPQVFSEILFNNTTKYYYIKSKNSNGVKHLAMCGILTYLNWPSHTRPLYSVLYTVNDPKINEDYAQKLIPRAVGYSAGLLDYFFRGRLEITQAVPVLRHNNFKYLLVDAKNITSTEEAMTEGNFVVSCRYTPYGKNSDGSEDKFTRTNKISCPSLEYNQEMTRMFFTFIDPIPKDAKINKITLVYRGKLGEEENAVIGTVLGADELTQHNFGKILLEEDWKNVSTDDNKWTHANGSAEQGECSSIVENGILTKKNIRYASQKIDLWNTSKYIPATPILITPNSSLQFKIDDMTVSHDIEAFQCIDLKFTNGTGLFFTRNDGKLYFRANTGFYRFTLGYIIIDNIYNLLKQVGIAVPEDLSLKEVSFTQMMWPANSPTEARHEQFMTSDFIQIIEGIRK